MIIRKEEVSYLKLQLQYDITSCCVFAVCVCFARLRRGYQQGMLNWQQPKGPYYDLQAALVTTEMDRVNCCVCVSVYVCVCVFARVCVLMSV